MSTPPDASTTDGQPAAPEAGVSDSPLDLLARLPASLDWAVMFRASMVRSLVDPALIPAMFGLPADPGAATGSFIVLTSAGCGFASADGGPLPWVAGAGADQPSLAVRWARQIRLLPEVATADCVGIGALPGAAPVVLAVDVRDGLGAATALFEARPDERDYGLLRAVGVRPAGGEPAGDHWRARFTNELPQHLLAAAVSRFSRTHHCNQFFLQHGRIDGTLAAGLASAASGRVVEARQRALGMALRIALAARQAPMPMTAVPVGPAAAYPYGDVVPFGFLLAAIAGARRESPSLDAATTLVRRHLDAARAGGLWPFHRGGLPTATDSALVLLGRGGADEVERLERFNDGAGAYVPQLWAAERDEARMQWTPQVDHWCQPDFGTTCLARALRAREGLPERTPLAWLEAGFARRSALYFANPYLVDWALALAVARDPAAGGLRARLAAEILAGADAEHGFGAYDHALSTALAVLALGALGVGSRAVRLAQVRLAELTGASGFGPPPTPFYSTERVVEHAGGVIRGRGVLRVGDEWHALTLYEDGFRAVVASLVAQALAVPADPFTDDPAPAGPVHPRYRARSAEAYVAGFALPPYIGRRP
ncbi:MAG: hypothetical protein AB7V01_11115 [Vicinamibacterales bacterium]